MIKTAYKAISLGTDGVDFNDSYDFGFSGIVKSIALYPDNQDMPTSPVFLKVEDDSGKTLVEALPQQAFQERQGGDFFTSKFPVNFETTRIRIKAFSKNALTTAFSGQLVFFAKENSNS